MHDVVPYDIDNVKIKYLGSNNANAYANGIEFGCLENWYRMRKAGSVLDSCVREKTWTMILLRIPQCGRRDHRPVHDRPGLQQTAAAGMLVA